MSNFANSWSGLAPFRKWPLTKNAGVPVDPKGARLRHVVLYTLHLSGVREILFELRYVEADLLCVLLQVVQRELFRIREELVVHKATRNEYLLRAPNTYSLHRRIAGLDAVACVVVVAARRIFRIDDQGWWGMV